MAAASRTLGINTTLMRVIQSINLSIYLSISLFFRRACVLTSLLEPLRCLTHSLSLALCSLSWVSLLTLLRRPAKASQQKERAERAPTADGGDAQTSLANWGGGVTKAECVGLSLSGPPEPIPWHIFATRPLKSLCHHYQSIYLSLFHPSAASPLTSWYPST